MFLSYSPATLFKGLVEFEPISHPSYAESAHLVHRHPAERPEAVNAPADPRLPLDNINFRLLLY